MKVESQESILELRAGLNSNCLSSATHSIRGHSDEVRMECFHGNIPMTMAGHDFPGTPTGFFNAIPMISMFLMYKVERLSECTISTDEKDKSSF
jgi:hypothetical protein